ncbi:MAG TPA: inorganic phosphate transporter [Candidatus Baltobacteraceae bacterium]|nr:inorganic phosphate transporter [Candidatus Baltobacteraceae bacterium]
MATTTTTAPLGVHEKMNRRPSRLGILIFGAVMILGLVFIGASIARDLGNISLGSAWPYLLLGFALLVALGFEFVNGFHDTANAVATVIYTHSLDPNIAVVWSGFWNFAGVVTSTGAVAFGIVSLLPVELILQVGSNAGFAMVFALLIAAILWNLGTWWFGLPASSSHTLIGSIIGVGIANQLMSVKSGTSGVDWAQALNIGKSLLLSPIFGFILAACLFLLMKAVVKDKRLYEAPKGTEPPPFWIRSMLIFTCTGVSFFHGSNDGQKGMGLIMLILIGTVPTTYALNHAVTPRQTEDFIAVSHQAADTVGKYVVPSAVVGDPRDDVTDYIRTKEFKPGTMLALRVLINDIGTEMSQFKQLAAVPREHVRNFRNDMYLVSEALRLMQKSGKPQLAAADVSVLKNYKGHIDKATRFIPLWVKVAVALALGLGTMIGWKRIVVTVGEKIGKNHLTYAQGAAAEITAMATIGAADGLGLPVSTTHVLSSGVAGTMMANSSGLQFATVRNLLLAWVLTLPAAMTLSGFLFYAFRTMFKG